MFSLHILFSLGDSDGLLKLGVLLHLELFH